MTTRQSTGRLPPSASANFPPPGLPMHKRSKSKPQSRPPQAGRGAAAAPPRRPSDDEAVDAEWKRIELDRVAEEVAEAREDILDAVPHPPRPSIWLWGGFAAALLAGVVFAVVVNVALAARRPSLPPPPPPSATRPPSATELGPGVGDDGVEPADPSPVATPTAP